MTDRPAAATPSPARRPADRLHLSPRHRAQLEALLREHLPGVEVWAYGSRITGASHDGSDLDLVLRAPDLQEIPIGRVSDLWEALRESTIPFLVEARDWARLPERFHGEIERDYVVLVDAAERCDRDGQLETKSGNLPVPKLGHYYHPSFPDHWHRMSLYSMARWVNGLAFRNITFSSSAVGRPVIKISEIKGGISGQTRFTCQNFDESARVHAGDLLFSWSGQPETSIDAFWWRGPDGWLNQHIFRVIPSAGIDTVFFFYLLKYLKPSFVSIARNKQTTGLGHVTKRDLENIEAALPDLREQRAIAHVLGTLDDRIELNRRMNETLEAMARALFQSWFVDFDPVRAKMEGRDTGLPTDVADLFPDRLMDSDLDLIPEGWTNGYLSDIAVSPRKGINPEDLSSATPYIGLEHMPRHSIALAEWETAAKVTSNKSTFDRGDILFGKLRPYFHKVGIAPVNGICSTDIMVIAPKVRMWYSFLLGVASSKNFVGYTDQTSTGTKMPRSNWKTMSNYKMTLPSPELASKYHEIAKPSFDRILANLHESRSLLSLRDSLLPELVSGTLQLGDLTCET